jgi:hypothetical protein
MGSRYFLLSEVAMTTMLGMRRGTPFAALALLTAVFTGCIDDDSFMDPGRTVIGSGNIVEETREIGAFTRVSHESIGKVIVRTASRPGLRIRTDDNLLDEIITEVENGTLFIRTRKHVDLRPSDTVTFTLETTGLTGISIAGAGSVDASGLRAQSLLLAVSGVGDLFIADVAAEVLDLVVSGVASVSLSGTVGLQDITVSGNGNIEALSLESAQATVRVTGLASMALHVNRLLDCTISGHATICYAGDPIVRTHIAGSGTVAACEAGP